MELTDAAREERHRVRCGSPGPVHVPAAPAPLKRGSLCLLPTSALDSNPSFPRMFLVGKSSLEQSGLPKGCLLYQTLQVQMLDLLDIEGLYPLYRRVERYLEEFPEQR